MSGNRSRRYGWLLGLSALLVSCDTFGDPAADDPFDHSSPSSGRGFAGRGAPIGALPVAGQAQSINLPGFGGVGGSLPVRAGAGGSSGVKAMPPAHDIDAGADDAGL